MACVAYGCNNRASKKLPGISFHRFPKNETARAEWKKAIRRDNWSPTNCSLICSEHFIESDFDRSSTMRVYLKPNVVPTVFKAFPKHLQKVKATRQLVHRMQTEATNVSSTEVDEERTSSPIRLALNDDLPQVNNDLPQAHNDLPQAHNDLPQVTLSYSPDITLKRKLEEAEAAVKSYQKKIKLLHQTIRRNKKKVSDLKSLMKECKNKGFVNDESLQILYKAAGPNRDLITRQLCKANEKAVAKEYSPELRKFALTLHFYSPRAYTYVRETFNSCLPHPRTISKWYQHVEVEPGFTGESMKALKQKVEASEMPLFFTLMFDEMAIRQHIEFDGSRFHGYVDAGLGIEDDSLPIAREALVFMVACINAHFKIPVGYFLSNSLTGEQKANLVKQCLILLNDCNVNIVSCTFDGLSSNLTMAKHLGCNLKPLFPSKHNCPPKQATNVGSSSNTPIGDMESQYLGDVDFECTDDEDIMPASTSQLEKKTIKEPAPLKLSFSHPITNDDIAIFLDPSHMVKLLRNCLGEKGIIVDANDGLISWKYVVELHKLQETEGLHLANKLKANHIFFSRQKMKVKLATQLFSKSVADAIEFCCNVLKLPQFQGSEATVTFLNNINDLFDILNSKNCHQYGYKQALNRTNSVGILRRLQDLEKYIWGLKVNRFDSILNSNRKTGFLGFLICIKNVIKLYEDLVASSKLIYLPLHKLSQDHVELFFQIIRSQGGCNNNPTVRQFKSAYRKVLVKTELKNVNTGNCSSTNELSLLTVSSSTLKSSKKIINFSTNGYRATDDDKACEIIKLDHNYLYSPYLNECSQHIVFYISGNVVFYLSNKLKCEMCVSALQAATPHYSLSLIDYKNLGNLIYPSEDVFQICKKAELNFRSNINLSGGKSLSKDRNIEFMANQTLHDFIGKTFFKSLNEHMKDMAPMENHIVHLMRSIIHRYLKIRFYHYSKTIVGTANSLRQLYTKTILFKGQ